MLELRNEKRSLKAQMLTAKTDELNNKRQNNPKKVQNCFKNMNNNNQSKRATITFELLGSA